MASKMLLPRRGTASGIGSTTVLASGELFFEYPSTGVGTGKVKVKMGDGTTAYSSLPYAIDTDSVDDVTVSFTATSSTDNSSLLAKITSGAAIGTIIAAIQNILSNLISDNTTVTEALDTQCWGTF